MPKPMVLRFFLGANSSQGFVSRFDRLGDPADGWRLTVIKGAPGSGKSSAMKKLAAVMSERCGVIEEIYCSSDVASLDGVVFPECRLSIADGTPPHTLEPQYPGAYESVWSLCDCWDEHLLYSERKGIMELSGEISRLHKDASSYLYAAGALLSQLRAAADDCTDHRKVVRLARSLAAREFPRSGGIGKEQIRFVSGITNTGLVLFEDTIATLAPRLYIIDDNWGAASSLLLATLRQLALENGHEIITCACPLFPFTKVDYLLLPALGVGFATRNKLHPVKAAGYRTIHARRFTDIDKLRGKKHRMAFLHRAATGMLAQATVLLADAKSSHDRLEAIYGRAMDFNRVTTKTNELVSNFLSRCSVDNL